MNAQQKSPTKVVGLVLAGILGASVGVVAAGVLPSQPGMTERGMTAWGQRLTHQAEAYRQERSNAAYGARLRLMAQERVNEAYVDRLNGLADAQGLRGMSDRAAQAWTDRLSGPDERD
jgi:hypothetical protein